MWKPRGCWASSGRCYNPPQNVNCKQQGFLDRPFSPCCPAVRDWISKSKYFLSLQSPPHKPDPDLLWEEKRKCQAGGRGPLEGQPNGREWRVVARGNPTSCPWNQRRGESCRGNPRARKSPLRKLKTNLAMVGHAPQRGALWKKHGDNQERFLSPAGPRQTPAALASGGTAEAALGSHIASLSQF